MFKVSFDILFSLTSWRTVLWILGIFTCLVVNILVRAWHAMSTTVRLAVGRPSRVNLSQQAINRNSWQVFLWEFSY